MVEPPGPPPVGETHREAEAGASPSSGRGLSCPICNATFKSIRGLGVHKAAKHRAERDAELTEERHNIKKARWDPEEKRMLAEHEVRLTRAGKKILNADLKSALPHRSLEAIKGQRRKAKHRKLVADLMRTSPPRDPTSSPQPEPLPSPSPDPEPSEPPRNRDPDVAWKRDIIQQLSELRRPDDSTTENWRMDMLDKALELINYQDPEDISGYEDIRQILDQHAEAIRPKVIKGSRKTRDPPPVPHNTARKKRRAEYALVQQQYRKDRKRCAQTILNGHWTYDIMTAKPKVTKEQQEHFWGALFNRESPSDQRPVEPVRPPQWEVVRPFTEEEVKEEYD